MGIGDGMRLIAVDFQSNFLGQSPGIGEQQRGAISADDGPEFGNQRIPERFGGWDLRVFFGRFDFNIVLLVESGLYDGYLPGDVVGI